MPSSAQQTLATIDAFLSAVGRVKSAASSCEPMSEPGGTTHPVKDVDDRLRKIRTGSRYAENTRDVSEDQGPPSVQSKNSRSRPGSAADDQIQIGTRKAPTGEDPEHETESVKPGKRDPGSSHPARTDNRSLDGHKWAEDVPVEKLATLMRDIGEDLCAQIAAVCGVPVKTAADDYASYADYSAWEPAGYDSFFDKQAADAVVVDTIENTIKAASYDADLFVTYMDSLQKQAEGEEPAMDEAEMAEALGGDVPVEEVSEENMPSEEELAEILGADVPVEDKDAAAEEQEEQAATEMAEALGADEPADNEAELANALAQMGLTPQDLENAVQQEIAQQQAMEAQAADMYYQQLAQKQAELDKFAQVRRYISEIVSRSRAR